MIDSLDGLWKARNNSFMVRIKTLNLSEEFTEDMLRFVASAEPVGDILPASIDLLRALKDTDLYAMMPSKPGKCLTVTDCDMPTVTGGCVIYGRVTNGIRVQSKLKFNDGAWGKWKL